MMKDRLCISNESYIDWMPQATPCGIKFDLDTLCLPRLGQEVHVWEAGADHDKRVAFLHCGNRGRGTKQADSAGSIWTAIRKHTFAEQSFDYGTTYCFSE